MKPIVGITCLLENKPHKAYSLVAQHYIRSVRYAGGMPILIPNGVELEDVEAYINSIDILLLSGGEDIAPYIYGDEPIKEVTHINPERDYLEIALVKAALKNEIPIFGICRGMQIINVALGGTLYQDIHQQHKDEMGHMPLGLPVNTLYHHVDIVKESLLFDIFEKERILVNSYHHQGVKKLGEKLVATAMSSDGIVEAFELEGNLKVLGVQFHPEDLTADYPEFVGLFKYFVDLVKG